MASSSGQRKAALAALLLAAIVGLNAAVVLVLVGITILHWREITTG
jgi:hypothetical protein